MRIILLTASALALTIGTSSLAQGNGNRGGGGGKPERVQGGGHGGGGGQAQRVERPRPVQGGGPRAERGNRGGGHVEVRQAERRPDREVRGNGRGRDRVERVREDRGRGNRPAVEDRAGVRMAKPGKSEERARQRLTQRRPVQITNMEEVARLRSAAVTGLVPGCPPGLAKKNNGCMPPGQARKQAQAQAQNAWYSNLWTYPNATSLSYGDGYLYRLQPDGTVAGYIPLLGGALWPGNPWPAGFSAYPVPDYHIDYLGLGDDLDYRFADGAIYAVDPQSDAIRQVIALITGDDWTIGQRMPDGYGVYNVPYQFRDQYYDTPESMYRYSDGYVYQVDPTTQLIQAAIQLIT